MNVSYKGLPHTLPAKVQQKLDGKFAKLAKLLDGRGEREAHVVVVQERRQHRAEVTVQFHDHQLVGIGLDADLSNALAAALAKLESQAVKQRGKWRVTHRHKDALKTARVEPAAKPVDTAAKKIFRVNGAGRRKPMTIDEALLEMEPARDYLVYRDAEREGLSVLVRRRDGHFDLIEA